MLNKWKINSLAVTNQVSFARQLEWSIVKCLNKFLVGYMLNKELSFVSHKIMTKPNGIDEKKTKKGNFQHHHIIITILIYNFLLLHGWMISYESFLIISVFISALTDFPFLEQLQVYSLKIMVVHTIFVLPYLYYHI